MMKIQLKSRNFEKLQRFSAFSRKSEQIRANFIKISENCDDFQNSSQCSLILMKVSRTF